jgi:hypothetical protein
MSISRVLRPVGFILSASAVERGMEPESKIARAARVSSAIASARQRYSSVAASPQSYRANSEGGRSTSGRMRLCGEHHDDNLGRHEKGESLEAQPASRIVGIHMKNIHGRENTRVGPLRV